uniref:Cadherin domain-containing protein n=1 Tax=Macrostomum lignano TaxID=282301 RepID=A0A1I8F3H9_9PLAT
MKNRVLDIMNLVKVALTPERVHILSVDKEIPDENNIYDIPIDSTVKYFTVSVSGRGVRIESLQDPFADSNGKAKHSIRVTGRSKLDFSHAFSTSLGNAYPVEIASNSTRPYL